MPHRRVCKWLLTPYDAHVARSDDTKKRLLDAAGVEFARHGIAGARTARIAAEAGVNEALLFRYFGSKQALFEQVYDSRVVQTVNDAPMDASSLPEYAGALFDYYRDHEQVLRLAVWMALERPHAPITAAVRNANDFKVAAIRRAQQAGIIAAQIAPGELLALVIQLSLSGASVSPATDPAFDAVERRASVVTAVRLLVTDR